MLFNAWYLIIENVVVSVAKQQNLRFEIQHIQGRAENQSIVPGTMYGLRVNTYSLKMNCNKLYSCRLIVCALWSEFHQFYYLQY